MSAQIYNAMTKEEFEEGYAERSGVTVKWLRDQGQIAAPCSCGDDTCQGWQMTGKPQFTLKTGTFVADLLF